LPPIAVMALAVISLAKRAMTVPFAEGCIIPSIMAMLFAVKDDAFEAAGRLYPASAALFVMAVADVGYCDL